MFINLTNVWNQLIHWRTEGPTHSLTVSLIDWQNWLTVSLADFLQGPSDGWLTDWLCDSFNNWLIDVLFKQDWQQSDRCDYKWKLRVKQVTHVLPALCAGAFITSHSMYQWWLNTLGITTLYNNSCPLPSLLFLQGHSLASRCCVTVTWHDSSRYACESSCNFLSG